MFQAGPHHFDLFCRISIVYVVILFSKVLLCKVYLDCQEGEKFNLPIKRILWAWTRQNLSSVFPTKRDSNQSPHLQRLPRKFGCSKLRYDTFGKRITKALISLHGCADWSAPLLFTNHRRQVFSRRGSFRLDNFEHCIFL